MNNSQELDDLAMVIYAQRVVCTDGFNKNQAKRMATASYEAAKIFIEVKEERNTRTSEA